MKMYQILLFTLALHVPVNQMVSAPANINDLEHAHQAYRNEDYATALSLYQNINPKNNKVHYNIGNCYFHLNEKGKALASWRRAEHNWGWQDHEELFKNINLVTVAHGSALPTMTELFYRTTIGWIRITPLLWIQLLVLLVWFFLFGYLTYLRRQRKRSIIITLFTILALGSSILAIKYSQKLIKRGVITEQQAALLSGPGETYQHITTLSEGTEVRIRNQSGGYSKISIPGAIGWIDKNFIEEI